MHRNSLVDRLTGSLATAGAFFFAFTAFLVVLKQLKYLPPTDPVAIGRVTVEGASKLRDYLALALFFVAVPLLTVAFRRLMVALEERTARFSPQSEAARFRRRLIFVTPLVLSPFFWLTTRKEGWALLLPLLLGAGALAFERLLHTRKWLRDLFAPPLHPFHALLLLEAASWILFRYITTATRIAHIPTLFLETPFIVVFFFLFEAAAIVVSRLAALTMQSDAATVFRRVALAATPLLVLPFAALTLLPHQPIVLFALAAMIALVPFVRHAHGPQPPRLRRWLALVIIPALLFVVSYASTAAPSWIDLFHRGETLGPASDYLRGKTAYRDVFALHGLLEDGLLDAWLMNLFGRSVDVALGRIAIIGALTFPVLFLLGFALFDSVPRALAVTALGTVTFVDNQRLVFHLAVVALLLAWWRWRRPLSLVAAGAVSGLAVFYSFDIGIYALAGSIIALVLIRLARDRFVEAPPPLGRALGTFGAGVVAGSVPFIAYLVMTGSLGAFVETNFVTIPAIIDATWSLPYPSLGATFRSDLSLRALADFVLGEKVRFILNPLVIGCAIVVLLLRARTRRLDRSDMALIILTAAAAVAQRSAAGRADFQHQYFAAYLLAPIIVVLAMRGWSVLREFGSSEATAFRAAAAAIAFGVAFVALWIPDLLNQRLDGIVTYRPRLSRIGYADPQGDAVRERVDRLRYLVNAAAKKGSAIYDFSNQPALYFLLDRPNPTRFYQVPIASPLRFQREIVRVLEQSKPPLVIRRSPERYDRFDELSNDVRAPIVAAYLDAQYEYWRSAGGIEIWKRRTSVSPPASPERPSIPARTADFSDEVMIFPAVGSVTGAGGAQWKGDLAFYNPHERPTRVRLRYSADRGNVERELSLAPFRTVMLTDVARNFFALPDSRGALFIRHIAGENPIVALQTYDATRPSSRYNEHPLPMHASATAKSGTHALSLIGLDQRPDRRINIGVVNSGESIVRLRIVCRTADGAVVGVPVKALIEEGMTYSLVDAPRELGVPLDGTVSVHIDLIEGSAIGYASVVDPSSGAHYTIPAVPGSFR